MNKIKHAEYQSNFSNNLSEDNVDSKAARVKHINNALNNILSDDKFRASPKMSAFLDYVVQETLSGKSDRIKAYSVAVDALGKPADFDPQCDPSVRVLANRLRATLENYYTTNPEQSLFIKLYRGSYVPHFIDGSGSKVKYEIESKEESTDFSPKTPTASVTPDTRRSGLQRCHLVLV